MAIGLVGADALVGLMGAEGAVRTNALLYLRISLLGVPALLVVLAGTGYLRGLQDTRTPLAVAVGTGALNLVLEVIFIYGLGRGLGASAFTTVVAQYVAAAIYLRQIGRAARAHGVDLGPHPASLRRLGAVGRDLLVRTAALRAALLVATAVATRLGAVDVAAHQIAFEMWNFLALVLDAIAIAGQAIVGRSLGAGDATAARGAGRRMIEWGVAGGLAGRRGRAGAAHRAARRVHRRSGGGRPGRLPPRVGGGDAAGERGGVRARRHPHRRGRHALPRLGDGRRRGGLHPAGGGRRRPRRRDRLAVGVARRC